VTRGCNCRNQCGQDEGTGGGQSRTP
jgi:hypothetical protein